MVLQMARPTKNPKTGIYYFRQKTPADLDLRPLLGDKIISWSLRTKDPDQAKVLNAGAVVKQARVWERHRKQPEPLPHAQIVALSGILYRDVMASMELEPGDPQSGRRCRLCLIVLPLHLMVLRNGMAQRLTGCFWNRVVSQMIIVASAF